jgi:hypothetical protein
LFPDIDDVKIVKIRIKRIIAKTLNKLGRLRRGFKEVTDVLTSSALPLHAGGVSQTALRAHPCGHTPAGRGWGKGVNFIY